MALRVDLVFGTLGFAFGFGGSMLFLVGGVGKVLSIAVIYLLLFDVVVFPYLPVSSLSRFLP